MPTHIQVMTMSSRQLSVVIRRWITRMRATLVVPFMARLPLAEIAPLVIIQLNLLAMKIAASIAG